MKEFTVRVLQTDYFKLTTACVKYGFTASLPPDTDTSEPIKENNFFDATIIKNVGEIMPEHIFILGRAFQLNLVKSTLKIE
jgi:hypothetical protein